MRIAKTAPEIYRMPYCHIIVTNMTDRRSVNSVTKAYYYY